jgi:hypothetical protein
MNLSSMLSNHPFWGILMLAVLVWYSTITIYVAVRGAVDIRQMLRKLKGNSSKTEAVEPSPPECLGRL